VSDADFDDAWEDFFQAARRARGRVGSATGPSGLTLSQFHLLTPLADGPKPVGALAVAAGVSGPTATRALDALARNGFVARSPCPDDRRSVLIELSPSGQRAVQAKRKEVRTARRKVSATLDEAERERATELLRRLTEVIEQL
jgi:DNA-binding MarR family transcriptional regulator